MDLIVLFCFVYVYFLLKYMEVWKQILLYNNKNNDDDNDDDNSNSNNNNNHCIFASLSSRDLDPAFWVSQG